MTSYFADKLGICGHTHVDTEIDAGKDNTQKPQRASRKNDIRMEYFTIKARTAPYIITVMILSEHIF